MAVEPDTGIITGCALRKASGPDNHEVPVGLKLLAEEPHSLTVLADAAYGSGEFRAELAARGHTDRVDSPRACRPFDGGFTVDDFTVDHDNRSATCPNGLTRPISRSGRAFFGKACTDCPLRARCTRSRTGKNLLIGPYDALQRAARHAARDPDWRTEYHRHRPMVERSIAWLTRGNRRLRYRGTVKKRPLAPPPSRRTEPAQANHVGPQPHRNQLGHRLTLTRGVAQHATALPLSQRRGDLFCRPQGLTSNQRLRAPRGTPPPKTTNSAHSYRLCCRSDSCRVSR